MSFEDFRATRSARLLGLSIDPGELPIADSDHIRRKTESEAMRALLPYVQQAEFGVNYYVLGITLVDAMKQIKEFSSRGALYEYLEAMRTLHESLHPEKLKPRWRGIAALGTLRVSTDEDERQRALDILNNEDPASATFYQAYSELYTGHAPEQEARQIQELLGESEMAIRDLDDKYRPVGIVVNNVLSRDIFSHHRTIWTNHFER